MLRDLLRQPLEIKEDLAADYAADVFYAPAAPSSNCAMLSSS
jgi:hypothetical protein